MRNKFAGVSDPHSFESCIGSRIQKIYNSKFDGSTVVLEETGSFDLQEKINSYAPYTDIAYMLNRLKVGDNSVLTSRTPLYGDFTGFPDNPTDAINLYHGAENAFAQLPSEEKLKYNNDFRVWLSSLMVDRPAVKPDDINNDAVVESIEKVEDKVNEP